MLGTKIRILNPVNKKFTEAIVKRKSNHDDFYKISISKYIAAETAKCDIGERVAMGQLGAGQLLCTNRGVDNMVGAAAVLTLADFANPQQAGQPAIVIQTLVACAAPAGEGSPGNLGTTQIDNTVGGTVRIRTCVNVDPDGTLNTTLITTG